MELNKIDLNKLNTFFAVAEAGGISAASKKLLLTRSAISQGISTLERSLGILLFHRVGKRLILTPAGQELFNGFRNYQHMLQNTMSNLATPKQEIQGLVRLGLFIGFSKARLTDFLSAFLSSHENAQVKLLFVPQLELANLLTENKIDFALSIHPLSKEVKSIVSTKLFHEELVLVSAPKFFKERPSLKEITSLPFIDYYQSGQLARSWVRHHFKKDPGSSLKIRAYGAAVDFVLELILKGAGVGVVPKYVADPYLKKQLLYQIKTGRPELIDGIWLNELKSFRHEAAPQVFLELIKIRMRTDDI